MKLDASLSHEIPLGQARRGNHGGSKGAPAMTENLWKKSVFTVALQSSCYNLSFYM